MAKGFDAEELQRAEGVYLADRSDDALAVFYALLLKAAPIVLRSYASSIAFRIPRHRVQELCHDAVTRLLERYLKDQEARSIPVSSRLFHEVRYQLSNPTRRRYEQRVGSLSITHHRECVDIERAEVKDYLANFLQVGDAGKRVIFILYASRSYKGAILEIAGVMGKPWIYRNAEKLATVYKTIHRRTGTR